MKKNRTDGGSGNLHFTKLLRVMKITWLLLTIALVQASASTSYSQSTKLTLDFQNVMLKEVFEEIENTSEFRFFYDSKEIDPSVHVSVNTKDSDIHVILEQILNSSDISYEIIDRYIVLKKDNQTSSAEIALANVQQQGKTVTGTIRDANGEPIPGASIVVKGTTTGTISDMDGNFTLSGVPEDATLQFSFVGMNSVEVSAAGQSTFNIVLQEETMGLDEVVVVGYGVQKKVNVTGSVATVDSKMLENRPMSSVSAGLSGLLPGVYVKQTSGLPGGDGGSIRIRGTGTLNNSSPMVIVDGVESSMNEISPEDIGSISVLKDAASAAIYGSKAANGVILITTKSGKVGVPQVRYSGDFGWQAATDLPEYLGSAEYAEMYNEALLNDGKTERFTPEDIALFKNGTDPYGHPNTDWLDMLYSGSGFQTSHNVSLAGGTENTTYRTSVNYQKQEGIIEHTGKDRYNVRTNVTSSPYSWLTSNVNLSYTRQSVYEPNNAYVGGGLDQIIRQAYRIAPWIPYKYEDGTYGTISDGNPMAWIDQGKQIDKMQNFFLGVGSLTFTVTEGLTVKGTASIRTYKEDKNSLNKEIQYNPSKYHGPTKMEQLYTNTERITGDLVANYTKSFGGGHNIAAMVGYHAESYDYKRTKAYRENFPSTSLGDLNGGATKGMVAEGYTRELNMLSYFGRVNYDLNSKYLFEANLRYDASSRFHEDNRWGAFPSFSAGWRLSEENFMAGLRETVDNLKVRVSWGMLGNQDALNEYYPTIPTLSLGKDYPFNSQINSGAAIVNAKNKDLVWEKTTSWGIGLDIMLKSKINLTLDYYDRRTEDIIMKVPSPETFALSDFYDNVGEMSNKGFEATFQYNDKFGEVGFNFGGNFALNTNELISLAGQNQVIDGRYLRRIGEPVDVFYGYKTNGLYQSTQDIADWAENTLYGTSKIKPGDLRYVDVTGDKKVTSDDRTILGKSTPDFIFGFNLGANYKNFDIMALFQGTLGGYGYMDFDAVGAVSGDSSKPSALWKNRWTPSNTNTSVPRVTASTSGVSMPQNSTTEYWLRSTDFLRLKNLQIGYNIPKSVLQNVGISKVRIYYSGDNLLTFTNYLKGFDPEAPSGRGSGYPVVMVNSFGVNVTF
ncbi:TonB-linked outer membrane protein, SusC/RagA family [Saccharicrinis carchari]|uniref:TonB-linked outer membrane protein, SusC/RagA family n=1 Tax=Saccharicrinis carchari TaxID=1168039 RepID=A0A521ABM1_SACCC|nr:TonB-dependent receptor [Saccharicrinis carchari]SMO32195.1 TonB-linked outer membrane protein, SusC/RagA family [Saccharicrinis carchari]